ncbi:nuclear transport factor 2 family protein [Halorubrum cibi]|uniref:Ketosteroid isomerase-related protein n=1 Tax=Halorubrum cibi TaxID=413815 RepID=A0A521CWZ9_9EURY|nr:nuclear transport factor 2 family protein [Halorubrum cibi]SMO63969.1 Ketosteroid isomerase-related protein [Halorubrum cibi]
MTPTTRPVRRYYEAIDAGEYDRLAALLDPSFVHRRPDRTLEGRDRFVAFMRDERPMTDTEHVVDAVYESDPDGDDPPNPAGPTGVAVQGRLLDADGDELFAFVDVFDVEDGRLTALRTYVRTDG